MTEIELREILSKVSLNYSSYAKDENYDQILKGWEKVLKDYSYEDIDERLDSLMAMEQFQFKPPTLPFIVRNIPTIEEAKAKTNFYFYCNICGRSFRSQIECDAHFDRCSSVRWVTKQYKKYFNKDLDKRSLYEMSEMEFKARYNKMLEYVHAHTESDFERQCIEHIWTPPEPEEAIEFLNRVREENNINVEKL